MKLSDVDRKALIIGIAIFLCMVFAHMLLMNSVAVRYVGLHENAIMLKGGTVVLVCPKCKTVIESTVEEHKEDAK